MRFIATLFLGLALLSVGELQAQQTGSGWLGADIKDLTKEEADALGWDDPRGAKVVTPDPGGPAEAAGLLPDDTLVLLDGVEIENVKAFNEALEKKTAGAEIRLSVRRADREKRLAVRLGTRPVQFSAPGPREDGPQPMLDAGGHIARLTDLAFTPEGTQLVSASDDKTIRVWDIATGKTVRFIRGLVGAGIEGQIFTIALSPDGRWLAVGGWFGKDSTSTTCCGDVRLYEFATGKLVALLKGHESRTLRVAFSDDGKRLITGSRDKTAIVWDVASRMPLAHLKGHEKEILAVGFSVDGNRAVTGSFDGTLRLWDAASGEPISTLKWDADGSSKIQGYKLHGTETEAVGPDGQWFATASGEDIVVSDSPGGKEAKRFKGAGAQIWGVAFSSDGQSVLWRNTQTPPNSNGQGPFEYEIRLPSEGSVLGAPLKIAKEIEGSAGVIVQQGPWSLKHSKGGDYGYDNAILEIAKNDTALARIERGPTEGYGHSSYSFVPGRDTLISGGPTGVLAAYQRDGGIIGDFIGHEGDVHAIAPSPDGRYLVSGAADRTVRLWNLNTRELLVTLFQGRHDEWVIWTPQGYYAASGAGAELIGWQINHGPDHEAEYVTAAQIRKSLNRPDIVTRAIQLASAEAAVKEAYGTNFKLTDLLAKPVPRFRVVSPSANAVLSGGRTEVEIAVDATPDPVKLVRLQVNGRQIAEHLPVRGGGFAPGRLNFAVPLAKGVNTIRLTAVNETGETSAGVSVTHAGDGDLDKRGTLYILAIGVDKYPNLPGNDLRFSGADAKAFALAMGTRVGPAHEKVVQRVLVNGASPDDVPTAANVLNALGLLRQARETDTIMVFVAGHGINDGPNYRFLPTDSARQAGGNFLPASVVPWYAFQEAIETAKGRRILFLDTCHSGNSYNQRLSNDSYQANIIVYSAARWDQFSWESPNLRGGHGLFTYAAVEGIEGKAAKDGGRITTLALRDFLAARVAELAKEMKQEQEPQYFRGRDAENYLLAVGQ